MLPGKVGQPRSHVLQTQVLHLYVGVPESLDTLLQEFQGEMGLVGSQTLADWLDEDGVVGRDTQTWEKIKAITFPLVKYGRTTELRLAAISELKWF